MRAFVTGATGFLGSHLAQALRQRGDDVVALVRSPGKASRLRELGCELVEGDLSDETAIRKGVEGCDSVFHAAAVYRVGIPKSERAAMYDANVRGAERVFDAATDVGATKIVHVSTINYFGNTHAKVVDETYRRPDPYAGGDGAFLSYYDETKWLAHEAALERAKRGAPIVIVQPGGIYGPGDTSELANLFDQISTGRLKFKVYPETGFNFVYVDDAVEGILLAHDKGRVGESYVLGGELTTLGAFIDKAAPLLGRKPPRFTLPSWAAKAGIPIAPVVTKAMRLPPNLGEMIRAAEGVTYWARDDKARKELGYSPRGLDEGLPLTLQHDRRG